MAKRQYSPIIWDVKAALQNSKHHLVSTSTSNSDSVSRDKNYDESYKYLVQFAESEPFDKGRLLILLNATYGWMPRIARITDYGIIEEIVNDLELVRLRRNLSDQELKTLMIRGKAFMGSIVGLSKMLHFIANENYAIFDSRVLSSFVKFTSEHLEGSDNYKRDWAAYRGYIQREASKVDNYVAYQNAVKVYGALNNLPLREIEKQLFGSIVEEEVSFG